MAIRATNGERARLLPRARLAQDRPGAAALTCVALALAPRVWTILAMPGAEAYRLFPWPAQAAVLAVYAGQLGAEAWGSTRTRAAAALLCAAAAGLSCGLFLAADWRASQWAYWAAQTGAELVILWRLAILLGRHEG